MDWLLGEIKGLMLILLGVMMKPWLCYLYKISLFILDIFSWRTCKLKDFYRQKGVGT